MRWQWRRFDALSAGDVYDLLALRADIFVVEQGCAFLDPDGYDRDAWHLCGRLPDGSLGAYLRCIDPGLKYLEPSIGRVVVSRALRGRGAGRALMVEGIARSRLAWPGADIVIGAQQRLESFYASLGFATEGGAYIEDGIPHVKMRLRAADGPPATRREGTP